MISVSPSVQADSRFLWALGTTWGPGYAFAQPLKGEALGGQKRSPQEAMAARDNMSNDIIICIGVHTPATAHKW